MYFSSSSIFIFLVGVICITKRSIELITEEINTPLIMFFCDSLSLWLLLITQRYKKRRKNDLFAVFYCKNRQINHFIFLCENTWSIRLVFDLDLGNVARVVM
ncbi:hypothetical protein HA39_13795 [Pantoea brenneri]|nr:hypothetical protein HA39_13795 [Pantoea brenneri]